MTDIIKNSNEAKDSSQIAPLRLSLEKFAELRKKGKIDLRRKSVEPPYTIKIDGIGALPRKDIFAIKAKSKQGKSQAATILLAGTLGCETLGIVLSYIVLLHQTTTCWQGYAMPTTLSYIVFLHQTTTKSFLSRSKLQLSYIVFLHQTTT